jgi:hypothetical protein
MQAMFGYLKKQKRSDPLKIINNAFSLPPGGLLKRSKQGGTNYRASGNTEDDDDTPSTDSDASEKDDKDTSDGTDEGQTSQTQDDQTGEDQTQDDQTESGEGQTQGDQTQAENVQDDEGGVLTAEQETIAAFESIFGVFSDKSNANAEAIIEAIMLRVNSLSEAMQQMDADGVSAEMLQDIMFMRRLKVYVEANQPLLTSGVEMLKPMATLKEPLNALSTYFETNYDILGSAGIGNATGTMPQQHSFSARADTSATFYAGTTSENTPSDEEREIMTARLQSMMADLNTAMALVASVVRKDNEAKNNIVRKL